MILFLSPEVTAVLVSYLYTFYHNTVIKGFLAKLAIRWWKTKDRAGSFTASYWLLIIFLTSLGVTGFIWGIRELKLLQKWELGIYDLMLRSRNQEPADSRILLVNITEDDLYEKKWNLSDQTINKLLAKLESYQPRVIGVNIYLPAQENFAENLYIKDHIFATCLLSNDGRSDVPPPNLTMDNVGFNDMVVDIDNVIRRGLLFSNNTNKDKKCKTQFSLGTILALSYLEQQGIDYEFNKNKDLQINNIIFPRLKANSGGYENTDNQGYQILLNYRHPQRLAPTVTLTQVMRDEVNSSLIKDKLVIIGTTAYSVDPGFYFPYSSDKNQAPRMGRLFIHGQIASQILSTVLDGRSLISYWPDHIELLWIWAWSFIGAILAWQWRYILLLSVMLLFMIMSLIAITVVLFLQSLWIPIISPIMALLISSFIITIYANKITKIKIIDTEDITIKVEEQAEAIAELNNLFNNTTLLQSSDNQDSTFSTQTPILKTGGLLLAGRYEIAKTLASGGFGRTYLAKDHHLPGNKNCVVKQLMPARRDSKYLEIARRLFHTEAEILGALGKHPQIPELLAYFEDNQEFYLVQEYIEGNTLNTEFSSEKHHKTEDFVIKMLQEVLEILVFVHHHHVIHRDIKPTNIMRCQQTNKLVLIDFGAVKCIQPMIIPGIETATIAIGTKGYTPPEQFAGHPRLCSDIYALGMMAIQAITGISPQELKIDPETGNYLWRNHVMINSQLANILDRMVCYHFSDRYQSASAVIEDLKVFLSS